MTIRPVRAAMAGILVGVLALTGCETSEPGDDVFVTSSSYGWANSFDAGYRFTDGVTIVRVGKGPATIKKIEPVMQGGSARLLGAQVRVLDASKGDPITRSDGWPPTHPDLDGAQDFAELVLPDPDDVDPVEHPNGTVHIEILLGYELVSEGRTARRGVNITYEIYGRQRTVFLGSYMAVCAPATVQCQHEDENGPVPLDAPTSP